MMSLLFVIFGYAASFYKVAPYLLAASVDMVIVGAALQHYLKEALTPGPGGVPHLRPGVLSTWPSGPSPFRRLPASSTA